MASDEPLAHARFRQRYLNAGRLRDIPEGWEDVEPGDEWVVNGKHEYVTRVDKELGVVEVV